MVGTMKTTIEAAGRLVIPKAVREAAGLQPGVPLDIRVENGVVEIQPASSPMRLERRGHFLVAVPVDEGPPPPAEIVEQLRQQIEDERSFLA
jgi:AbrB family looped-hinge helix DNA binding protein